MTRRFLLILCTLTVSFSFAACNSTKMNQPSAPYDIRVEKTLEPDVAVGDEIKGTANVSVLFGLFTWGASNFAEGVSYGGAPEGGGVFGPGPEAQAKSAAIYDAVQGGKADLIVTPSYVMEIEDYFVYRTIKAEVRGYAGKVSSIK